MKAWTAAALALAAAGCSTYTPPPSVEQKTVADTPSGYSITYRELDQQNRAFADRYVTRISNACSAIKHGLSATDQRARAHTIRLMTATSAYDVVSGSDPYQQLLNLAVLAELQKILYSKEGRAEKLFGSPLGALLATAVEEGAADAWRHVDRVLKPEQRTLLQELISAWRRENPGTDSVAMVRFDEFSLGQDKSALDDIPHGSGLLAPIGDALREVEQARLLGERGLYLAKRMPVLMNWHAESVLNEALTRPETVKSLEGFQKAVEILGRVSDSVAKLPDQVAAERKAIFATLEEREKSLGGILKDVKESVTGVQQALKSGNDLVRESRGLVQEVEPLLGHFDKSLAKARPFNIVEYTAAASELTKAVHEANELVKDSNQLLESKVWNRYLEDVNAKATERFNHAALLTCGIITFFFAMLVASRWITLRMTTKAS